MKLETTWLDAMVKLEIMLSILETLQVDLNSLNIKSY